MSPEPILECTKLSKIKVKKTILVVWHVLRCIEHWCKSCVDCAMKKSPNTKRAPLLPLPVEGAFDRVTVDVLRPFRPSNRQNLYIVLFSGYLTRWCEAFPVPGEEANAITRLLVDEIIARHSAPRVLLLDTGTNFLSKLEAEVCKLLQIQNVNTSSYQTDGLVERFNSTPAFANHFL